MTRLRRVKSSPALLLIGWLLGPSLFATPQNDTLRVGLHDVPPLVFMGDNGEARGFIIEILEDIAGREGWTLEYVFGSWQQGYHRLQNGEIDLLFPMFPSEERIRLFRFGSVPIISTWGRIFARRGINVESVLELEGLTIAVLEGDIFNQAIRDLVEGFGLSCRFLEREGMEAVFQSVAERDADVAAVERIDGIAFSERYGFNETHVVFHPGSAFFTAGKSGNSNLDILDDQLRSMKADPDSLYHRAYEKWIGQGRLEGPPPWLRGALIAAGGLVLALGVFVLVLRHQVRIKTRQIALRNARMEREIIQRRAAEDGLKRSLDEKNILLKEIHHRVKNNLQVISSMLRLKSRDLEGPALIAFQESQERIMAIALVHKELYGSENFGRVKLGIYINKLLALLVKTHRETADRIEVDIRADEVDLPIEQAVPCGLILNELVTNAFRHAFPPLFSHRGRLQVELFDRDGVEVELMVRDNGIGMPDAMDVQRVDSLGLRMIVTMVENQLGGTIRIDPGKGTTIRIRFPRVPDRSRPEGDQGSSRRSTS